MRGKKKKKEWSSPMTRYNLSNTYLRVQVCTGVVSIHVGLIVVGSHCVLCSMYDFIICF